MERLHEKEYASSLLDGPDGATHRHLPLTGFHKAEQGEIEKQNKAKKKWGEISADFALTLSFLPSSSSSHDLFVFTLSFSLHKEALLYFFFFFDIIVAQKKIIIDR